MSAVPSPLPTGDTGHQRTKIDRFTSTESKKKKEKLNRKQKKLRDCDVVEAK